MHCLPTQTSQNSWKKNTKKKGDEDPEEEAKKALEEAKKLKQQAATDEEKIEATKREAKAKEMKVICSLFVENGLVR